MILDKFDTLGALKDFAGPVLVMHGRQDALIPVAHAEALHEAASDSKLVLYDGGHNNTPPSWPTFWGEVDAFLGGAGLLGPA